MKKDEKWNKNAMKKKKERSHIIIKCKMKRTKMNRIIKNNELELRKNTVKH